MIKLDFLHYPILMQVGKILDDELLNHFRNGAKLKTKNGVIITQRNKLMQQIKMHLAESEVSFLGNSISQYEYRN